MSRPFRLVLRFLTVVLILALASVALAPTSSPRGPYLSALADLAAGSAFAAPPDCAKMACSAPDNCTPSQSPTRCGLDRIGGCATFHC